VVTSPPDPLSFPRRGGSNFLREALPLFYSPVLPTPLLDTSLSQEKESVEEKGCYRGAFAPLLDMFLAKRGGI